MLAREYSRGAADGHDEVRGRTIGVHGSDVVDDGLFGRADKPRRAHDDLNDVHGFPGALVQADAEVAGEVIENQVPAVERLQHQDLFDRGLSFARRRNDHQQAAQQRTLQSAANAAIRWIPVWKLHLRIFAVVGNVRNWPIAAARFVDEAAAVRRRAEREAVSDPLQSALRIVSPLSGPMSRMLRWCRFQPA